MKQEIIIRKEFDLLNQDKCFLDFIDVSKKTKETYKANLKPFMLYIKENGIERPTRNDIINYREKISETLKPTTVNGYMIAVRQFFGWLEYMRLYPNITEKIKGVKIQNTHRKNALTKEQVKEMISIAKNLRDKCLLELLFTTGIRSNELKNSCIEDIKEINGKHILYILGKGKVEKDDFVVLSDNVFNDLKAYIGERTNGNIFISLRCKKNQNGLENRQIRGIVKQYLKEIGLDSENYSCHSTRHTFINLAFELGNDLYTVSKEARHSNMHTTQIYLEEYNKLNSNISNQIGSLLD